MPRPTLTRQRGPNGRFLSSHDSVTATEAQHSIDLFALPPEIRLAIYKFLFRINGKCTLRRLEDITSPRRTTAKGKIKLFDNSILTTCKTIHTEALPLFYASQTFHYSTELDGLFRQPTVFEGYLGWVKHLSVDVAVTTRSLAKLDAIIGAHVQTIITHCAKLSSFTLHFLPVAKARAWPITSLSQAPLSFNKGISEGAAAKALSTLRPRLDRLSVVYFENWYTLHHLRKAIADDDHWVEEGKCYEWPGLSLTEAQNTAVNAPQRRYTLAGSENIIHPHCHCIRVFHAYRSKIQGESRHREL